MSKYIDTGAILQVLGILYNNPSILQTKEYIFHENDFVEDLQKIIFKTIYNLYELGADKITILEIENYLESRPQSYSVYEISKGREFLTKCSEFAERDNFNYYYNRIKKMSLLRAYESLGLDLKWLYDPDELFDSKKKQIQEDKFDNLSVIELVNLIENKIKEVREIAAIAEEIEVINLGNGVFDLLEKFKQSPDIGYPLYGKYINTISRGARLGKFYLRSMPTNIGKTRMAIADCCYIGCDEMYDIDSQQWLSTGVSQDTLFIATEQEIDEIQSAALAFLSAVDEEHIVLGRYEDGEWDRVVKAATLLQQSKIRFVCLSNFNLEMIEHTIEDEIRKHNVTYVFLDYIHTSMKILEEITKRSGGVRLREDHILFMISAKLKEIAVSTQTFISSSTQLNGDYVNAEILDQNCLRGAKAIADKIDLGTIAVEITEKDRTILSDIVNQLGLPMPNIKMSVYKNRGNKWKSVLLWINANKSICRYDPIFVTDYNYKLLPINDFSITIEEKSAF